MAKQSHLKQWSIAATIALAVIGLYFYSKDDAKVTTQPEEAQVTIKVLGEDSSNLSAIATLAKEYTRETGVKIEIVARSFEEAFTKSNQDFVNGTGLYNIVLQYNFALGVFVPAGYVHKLSDLKEMFPNEQYGFEDKLFAKPWKEVGYYRSDGRIEQVGYPFATNTMLMVYNSELFNDPQHRADYQEQFGRPLNAPATWEEYRDIAKFFSGVSDDLSGVALQGAAGGWAYYEWAAIMQGFGQTVMDKEFGWDSNFDTPLNLDSPGTVQAMEYYLSLKETDKSTYINVDQNEQIRLLKANKAVMGLVWSDYIYSFFSDGAGNFDQRFSFAPLPGEHSPLAGGAFYINKDAPHHQEAYRFILYLMQEPNQIKLAKAGLISPMRTVYNDSGVKVLPYSDAIRVSLERGTYAFEAGPDSDLISNVVTETIQSLILNAETNPAEILEKAQQRIYTERKNLQ